MRRKIFPSEREQRLVEANLAEFQGNTIVYSKLGYLDDYQDGEEQVRADLYYDLVTDYGYGQDKVIEFEKLHKIGHPHKKSDAKVDIIVRFPDLRPFMVMELKSPEEYENYLESSVKTQLFNVAAVENQQHNSIKYLVYHTRDWVSDRLVEKTICIDYEKWKSFEEWDAGGRVNLRTIPINYAKVSVPKFIRGGTHVLNTSATREEMQRIRRDLHNILWGGGKYQNELFFNLVGLFLAKIYDEKETEEGKPYKFQIYFEDGEPEAAADVYSRMNNIYFKALKEYLKYSDSEISKIKDIVFDANKVRYVVEALQGISFTTSRFDIIGDFFEGIVRGEFKQSKGQYLTHTNLINFIVSAMDVGQLAIDLINEEKRLPWIIDPSCGSGAFLVSVMQAITHRVLTSKSELKKTDSVREFKNTNFPDMRQNAWAREFIHGIEINGDLAAATKVNMVGHGDGSANIEAKDGLAPFSDYEGGRLQVSKSKTPYYQKPVNEQFDVVLSNPPFSVTVDRETARGLPSIFERGAEVLGGLKDSKELEVATELLFIERYYQLLRPGGRLGVVLPESVFDAASTRDIRIFIFQHFHVLAIISLPPEAFAPYTTTKTSILLAQKKLDGKVKEWKDAWQAAETRYAGVKDRVSFYTDTPALETQIMNFLVKRGECIGLEPNKLEVRSAVRTRLGVLTPTNTKVEVMIAIRESLADLMPEPPAGFVDETIVSILKTKKLDPNIEDFYERLRTPNLFAKALEDLLGEHFRSEDLERDTNSLQEDYEEAVRSADMDWWCFRAVAKQLDESIFMAHAQHIGYKRGARGEDNKLNELMKTDGPRDYPPFILDQFLATNPWKVSK